MTDNPKPVEPTGPSFTPCSGDTWRDPFGMYAELRDQDPVHHVAKGDYWVLSRFDDVLDAARDHRRFSSAEGLTFSYGERQRAGLTEVAPMVMLDPPEHTAFRRLVSSHFTPLAVTRIEGEVRAFVQSRLNEVATAAADHPDGEVDIVAALLKPLPSMVVAHFLGVPESDRANFDRWTEAIVSANAQGDALQASDAVGELFGYFSSLIARRGDHPSNDTISSLVHTTDGPTPMQILGFAFTMVAGGNDTTTGLLGGSLELLSAHPEQRAALVERPDLIGDALEELLRLTCPVQGLARTTTTDVELHGRVIPVGKKVMLLYASANRDPREFGDDAEELDIRRQPRQILSFSSGAHHCLGAAAARLQGRVALEEILGRFPNYELDVERATFAPGSFVRRHQSLPMRPYGRLA
ncbi:MAG: cytochrome P450 [Microthrixaceae bacterium]